MLRFIIRRIVLLVPVFIGLSMLVFVIGRILPGDPVQLAAGPHATKDEIAALAKEFGLDQPLAKQYLTYARGLAVGDWGRSIQSRQPVLDDLKAFLPATLELVFAAMFVAVVVGIPMGLISAVYRDRWPDVLSRAVSLGSVSIPRFFLGLLLQLAFAMWLGWLPLGGRIPIIMSPPPFWTGFYSIDTLISGDLARFLLVLQHMLMPAVALSLSPLATITRMMRASTLEVLSQDYVITARALGLSQRLIVFKYVLKNALSASLTVIGLYFGWLLGGTVLVETVFDWPGIGLYATKAITSQDFMPIMGVTLCIGLLFVTVNLLVDLAYGFINPKVRLS